jgi:hypothetical protein
MKQKFAAGKMSGSKSLSDTSSEEFCVNFSIQLLQSLSEEEEPASPSQQETQEKYDVPRPTLQSNRSISCGSELMSVSDSELSAIL